MITGSGFRLDGGRVLRNQSSLTWSGGQILFNNTFNGTSGGPGSGTIANAAGTIFNVSGDSATSMAASNFGGADTGADALFTNAGIFSKAGSSALNVTTVDVTFNNSGTVQAQTGVLNLSNGGTHSRLFDVAAGAVLGFSGGTHDINAGSVMSSPGTVRISGSAAVNLNTTYNVVGTTEIQSGFLNLLGGAATTGSLIQSSGSIAGARNLIVTGPATITFGDHRGPGTTMLQGPTSVSGSGLRLEGGRVLQNSARLTWDGGQILFNNTFNGNSGGAGSGTIDNLAGATFVASGDGATSIAASNFGGADTGTDATINNAGMRVDSVFDNRGVLNTAADAVFVGNNNNFTNTGRIEGSGTVRTALNDDLLNVGVIAPGNSTGTLTLDGDLTMGAAGRAQFEVTSTTDFDALVVTDAVLLTGTLEVLNLGYTPVAGDSFRVLSFNQRLSDSVFGQLIWSGFNPGVVFTAVYGANDVTLNVSINAVPEPETWALWLAGAALVAGVATRRRRSEPPRC